MSRAAVTAASISADLTLPAELRQAIEAARRAKDNSGLVASGRAVGYVLMVGLSI